MQSDLPLLISLQKLDATFDDLRKKSADIDPLIARKKGEIDSLKNALKTAKDKSNIALLKKKDLEGQVEEKEKLIRKHQNELGALKSNDAYKAMLGEIETAKNEKTKIEDNILVIMEQMDSVEKEYKATELTIKNQEGSIKAAIQSMEKEKADFDALATTKKTERDAFAATIAPASLSQYEALRSRRGGFAIVAVSNNGCGGCQMSLPPNKIIQLKKAQAVVFCENCSRILYLPEPTPAESTATPAPSVPAA